MKQFIVKFQNLKHSYFNIIRANQKKINVKNNLKQIKSNFLSIKIWNKSHQNFSTTLLESWEIYFITWMLAVCACVYGLTILILLGKASRLTRVFFACATTSQVEWQATLRTLDATQTLVVLWLSKPDIRRGLALLGSNSDRSDLVKDQGSGGIAWEKGDSQIINEQWGRHLVCCWSVLRLE